MNGFVEACRREWKRIGVPDGVANEMAADLEADLTEAEADGVSAEEVLGNGVFDAPSFAASWAAARGVATATANGPRTRRSWALLTGAAASIVLMLIGAALVGPVQRASVAVAAVHVPVSLHVPGMFVGPRRVTIFGPGVFAHAAAADGPVRLAGLLLLVVGVIGLAVTLWLWRSRRRWHRPDPPGFDDSVRMPSYL